jgi:hypothetical protein
MRWNAGDGIGRMPHALEVVERDRILKAYEARARKGRGGTHQGRKKKKAVQA